MVQYSKRKLVAVWERWLREKSKDLVEARIPEAKFDLDLEMLGYYVHQRPRDNLSQKNAAMQKKVLHCCVAASIH